MARERNSAVLVLVGLATIAGFLDVLDVVRYMGWPQVTDMASLNFSIPGASWLGALLSLIIGVIWFVVAKWLYDLNPRGWKYAIVLAILNLFLLLLAWLGNSTWRAIWLGVMTNIIALNLALLPDTRTAYGQN